jgi:succinoglycan biosynthesis protein ExoA
MQEIAASFLMQCCHDMNEAGDTVLIVVPVLNEERHLPSLLDWLINENPNSEIVVADGGSVDRSRDIVIEHMARHADLKLLDNPRRIQSAGINLAVSRYGSGHRWLVRIDAHCHYPDGYVDGLTTVARARGAQSVTVPMVSEGRNCFQQASAAAQNSVLGTGGSPHRHLSEGRFVDHGHHALMDLQTFRAAGGYDERLSHNEDAELDTRIRQSGGRIWLAPDQALTYFPRSTARSLARQYWNYGRGRAKTRAMHGERLRLRQLLPLAVPAAFVITPAAYWWPVAVLPILAWMILCLVAGALIRQPGPGLCRRLAGVAAIIMHFSWGWGFLFQTLFGSTLAPTRPERDFTSNSATARGLVLEREENVTV